MSDSKTPQANLDFKRLREEAKEKLPLSALFAHYGKTIERPTRWGRCPDCDREGKFRIFDENRFQCVHPACRLHGDQLPNDVQSDHVGLIAVMDGVGWKEATNKLLLLAGLIDHATYDRLMNPEPKASRKPKKTRKPREPKEEKESTPPPPEPKETEPPEEENEHGYDDSLTPEPEERKIIPFRSDGNPWHELWQKLVLADSDRTKLIEERGLSRKTVEHCGFKTSRPANKALIEELRKRYDDEELVEAGILQEHDTRGLIPEPQLCGWGNTGEKDPKTGEDLFGQTNPVLIPYFDSKGEVVTIRAHKGGLKKRLLPGEIGYTNYSKPYGEHLLPKGEKKVRRVIITEGELKAAAAWQCGFPTLAVPGISFINNEDFRKALISIIRRNGIKEVVIIYDNEVKDDPTLPSYKADESKRYDVYVWANVLARHLDDAGIFGVRIGQLPDEFRVKGKADFDGILKELVRQHDGDVAAGTKAAGEVFNKTIQDAHKPVAFLSELFPTRAQQIIHSKVIRYTRKRTIEIGGDEQEKKARLFRFKHSALAAALRETIGCYFIRKVPDQRNPKRKEWEDERAQFMEKLELAKVNGMAARDTRNLRIELEIRNELLKGWPEVISNFNLECLYKVRGEESGDYQYYCKAWVPLERKVMHCLIPPRRLSRIAEMREWASGTLGASWMGGEKDLQAVKLDLDVDAAYKQVSEVCSYGQHHGSGLFIWGDCAWTKEGERILPDDDMVFWHEDQGYQIDTDPNNIGEGFGQGAPRMHPEVEDRPDLVAKTREWLTDFRDTMGGFEGWAVLGATIGYLAMPEFFRKHGTQHPGIWLHGVYGEGKTKTADWLCRFHGFENLKAPGIDSTTPVALTRWLAQYSMMIVFFDEFRGSSVSEDKVAMLRYAFDRASAPKGRIDDMRKTRTLVPLTTPLVCGESECFDAATRSRYVQTVVSKARRAPDPGKARFNRLQEFAPFLYQVSRRLMDKRRLFESAFLAAYDQFHRAIDEKDLSRKVNDRAGVTYGVAYAGMAALVMILEMHDLQQPVGRDFLEFLLDYMTVADADTRATGVIETFWEQFISAIRLGAISTENLKRIWVVPHESKQGAVSLASGSMTGAREAFVFNYSDCFAEYQELLRKRGEDMPVRPRNLRKYMENQPYWVWRHKEGWKQKFNQHTAAAWGVYLDEFPWADEIRDLVEGTNAPLL